MSDRKYSVGDIVSLHDGIVATAYVINCPPGPPGIRYEVAWFDTLCRRVVSVVEEFEIDGMLLPKKRA